MAASQLAILETCSTKNLSTFTPKEKVEIKTGFYLVLELAIKASGKELEQPVMRFIVNEFLDWYSHENINDIVKALKLCARRKIYGSLTLNDLIESMKEVLEENAENRERQLKRQKDEY